MKFSDLLAAGRAMTADQHRECLRSLTAEPRFSGFLGMLDDLREESITWQTRENASTNHGTLAYGAGVIGAFQQINDIIRAVAEEENSNSSTEEVLE